MPTQKDLLDPKKLAFAIAKAVAGAAVIKSFSLLIEKLTDLIGLVDDTMEEYYNKLRKAQIEDATLRAALQRFATNRNLIASNYASLTASFADLPKDTRRAADEIYQQSQTPRKRNYRVRNSPGSRWFGARNESDLEDRK